MNQATSTYLERVFLYNNSGEEIKLTDPNKDWNTDQVKNYYSNIYPELTNGTCEEEDLNTERVVYRFKTTIGTKG